MKQWHRRMRTNLRWGAACVALANLSGCSDAESPPLDFDELGTIQQAATLDAIDRLPTNPTGCFVSPPGIAAADLPSWNADVVVVRSQIARWEAVSGLAVDWKNQCRAPDAAGVYPEDIRILVVGPIAVDRDVRTPERPYSTPSGPIPGVGCARTTDSDFGSFPAEQSTYDNCEWNSKIDVTVKEYTDNTGPIPVVVQVNNRTNNHILHEFGHMMGFAHEHARDIRPVWAQNECQWDLTVDESRSEASGNPFLAGYDVYSVMHYSYDPNSSLMNSTWWNCRAPGNWGESGLSALDKLAAEIVYPTHASLNRHRLHADLGIEFAGGLAVREDAGTLQLDWSRRGAKNGSVFSAVKWTVDGNVAGTSVVFDLDLAGQESNIIANFTTLFGDRGQSGDVRVEKSNAKHTAVVMAAI